MRKKLMIILIAVIFLSGFASFVTAEGAEGNR